MQMTLWGLRGGAGTTSLTAMLGDALSLQGESVLLVDLNPSDLLRLHFNIPYTDAYGWASGSKGDISWYEHAYHIKEGLRVLPYGRQGTHAETGQYDYAESDAFWARASARLRAQYSWVIFDMPAGGQNFQALRKQSRLDLMVAPVDMASHVLLSQCVLGENTRILVNGHDPAHSLSNDILLDWRVSYRRQLLPVMTRRDENIHEAMAHKMPATTYFPDCSGANDVVSLATWCIAQRGVQP